ncbi:cofactor assembly of complex C subunit B [Synechococcus sp. Nb3U1]|uniref:cofactor assembly of complex C subunit B n=1 Tax=Synechococcus sp. Nb3U1 TaxID=1914529 RepID=UPI001F2E47A4|nr:cofactor assembly of complex C subunit B [Synechococcus sp. Nb3U1]
MRRLPLVTGLLGSGLLVLNRLAFTPELATSQSRSDALGILLSALLILTGLLWQQIQPIAPKNAPLQGIPGLDWHPDLSETAKLELAWASHTLLTTTAARTVLVWLDGQTLLQRGLLASAGRLPQIEPKSILQRVLQTGQPVYLVDLKLFPARAEFDGILPTGSQAVLCQPIGQKGCLILGSDTPRSFTQRDQAWIAAIASKLDVLLSGRNAAANTVPTATRKQQ